MVEYVVSQGNIASIERIYEELCVSSRDINQPKGPATSIIRGGCTLVMCLGFRGSMILKVTFSGNLTGLEPIRDARGGVEENGRQEDKVIEEGFAVQKAGVRKSGRLRGYLRRI